MSNNHVLANSNFCFGDDPILQPGPADITRRSGFAIIGMLDRWHPLSKERRDGIDAAIARLSDNVKHFIPWQYDGIGKIKPTPVRNRFSVTKVIKLGKTTGVTRGHVTVFDLDGVQIDYGTKKDPAVVTFDGQIEIVGDPQKERFSAPGDAWRPRCL